MLRYFLLYKPFQVLTQFSAEGDKKTLADVLKNLPKDVYPVGRLDYDSEGCLLLTNDKKLTHRLLDPRFRHVRTYYVQVEGTPDNNALQQLARGITITVDGKPYKTLPAKVALLSEEPILPERNPPIRFRKNIPTSWIAISITEGKNRQVRKMTAAAGFPTLRLVRYAIANLNIDGFDAGEFQEIRLQDISLQ